MSARWAAVAAVAVIAMAFPMRSQAATLAPTPYMGWNTYYGVGGVFDEATIKSVAETLISSGLAKAGYTIVWLDYGWASGARDSSGQLVVDPTQWPDGMKGLTDWLHQQGLEAGIYTDAGTSGCYGEGVGSYGHYQQDANTFAAWGFDAVKVDFCGAGQEIAAGQIDATPQQLYAEFSEALANNSSHRPMILNVCNFWTPGKVNGTDPSLANSAYGNYVWAPQIAQSWRTDTDIGFGGGKGIAFSDVLRNLSQDASHPEAAGPGHWNDPDYLGPGLGMTDNEAQAQFSMWAMLAAPLILGSDPRALSQAEITMLENQGVIAIDQDSLGAQGTLVSQSGSGQVWAKPLANGDVAVALLNTGPNATTISTTASAVGLPQASSYTLNDLWANTTTTTTTGQISASVPAQSVTMYRVTPVSQTDTTAMLRVSMASADSGTVSASPGPISCPGTCSARYPAGSPVTLTATPTGGAAFLGWNGGGCSGTGTCSPTTNSDASLTANFVFPLHTLTVNVDGTGSVTDASGVISCPGTCSAQYWPATNVGLTATPGPGMVFAGWSGACAGIGTCTVPLNEDAAVTAKFAPPRKLTVSVIGAGTGTVTGPGISCPGTCSATYPEGTSVTLSAAPGGGSQFGAWLSGGCTAFGSSCPLTLSSDMTVTAAFDRSRSGTAYVVNTGSNRVTPIDLATDTAQPAITGFRRPRSIAVAPDGGTAYVVNSGNSTVTPINLATNATEPSITGFNQPGPIAVAPGGRTAYVLEANRRLVPVDLETDTARRAITFRSGSGIGQYPGSIAISPDGKTAYLGTFTQERRTTTGSVAEVDLATGGVRRLIRGFARPAAIALGPGGKIAYVADAGHGNLTAINLATGRSIKAGAVRTPGALPGADGVAVAPDGRTAYVADRNGVTVIDVSTHHVTGSTGIVGPRAIALTANGGTVYVTAPGRVVPIDAATDTERAALIGVGYDAAIAITVPPPRGDSVTLATPPRIRGGAVRNRVRCLSSSTRCTTVETLTVGTTAVGRRIVALAPGRTVTVRVALNSAGRRLLQRFGSLNVVLIVAIRRDGHVDTLTTRRLTIP